MRIAFSGTGNSGKSTMVKSFLHTWQQYETPEKTYRDILEEENLTHSTETSIETQNKILDFMVDQVVSYDKDSKVVFSKDLVPKSLTALLIYLPAPKLLGLSLTE